MKKIGEFSGREVLWMDYHNYAGMLPAKDWVCLAFCNTRPDNNLFDKFVREATAHGIMYFGGHGNFGELLHDMFDETLVQMTCIENQPDVFVATTWHNYETVAAAFWQYCYMFSNPETAYLDEQPGHIPEMKIVCTNLDGEDMTTELQEYLKKFEEGWLPPDEEFKWGEDNIRQNKAKATCAKDQLFSATVWENYR